MCRKKNKELFSYILNDIIITSTAYTSYDIDSFLIMKAKIEVCISLI